MPPVKHSDALRERAGVGLDALAGRVDQPRVRVEAQRHRLLLRRHHTERCALGKKVAGESHDHRGQAAGVAAQIDHDPIHPAEPVHRRLEFAIDCRHPHVEADHPDVVPCGRRLHVRIDAYEHGRQAADRHRLATFRPAHDALSDRRVGAVEEGDVHG